MNITTPPVSFLPTSAAQPTDVLRRDNQVREVISQVNQNEAFQRERGMGSDAERAPNSSGSYANQLAEARIEAGFPRIYQREGESQGGRDEGQNAEQQNKENQGDDRSEREIQRHEETPTETTAVAFDTLNDEWRLPSSAADSSTTPVVATRLEDGSYDGTGMSVNYAMGYREVDEVIAARGDRIERFYQSSYRPNESFLLGVA